MLDVCERIVNMQHNYYSLFLMLQGYPLAKSISDWFHGGTVESLKNSFYNYAKLRYIYAQPPYNMFGPKVAYSSDALEGMYFLLSDHEPLIQWYTKLDYNYDKKSTNNIKSVEFYTQQFFIALRGEWDVLIERCERIIANPPTNAREKKFMLDHQFYLALAKGDVMGMEAVIKELVSPKKIANRKGLESGFTADLICTPAIIYSKLAWRNGYEIVVDSPYIPKEWLPIKPLEKYEDMFEFMKAYTV